MKVVYRRPALPRVHRCFLVGLLILPLLATAQSQPNFYQELKTHCHTEGQVCGPHGNFNRLVGSAEQIAIQTRCREFLELNRCASLHEITPENQRFELLSCETEKICEGISQDFDTVECSLSGVRSVFTLSGLLATVGTAAVATVAGSATLGLTVVGLPLLIIDSAQSAKSCNENIAYKKMLVRLHNAQLLETEQARLLDFDGANRDVLRLDCVELQKFLQMRLEVLVKKRFKPDLYDAQYKPELLSPLSLQILEAAKSGSCLKPDVTKRKICETLSAVATGVALGGGTVLATAKVMNRTAAIEAAHLVGRGERGQDGTAAKVGNYTFKQKLDHIREFEKHFVLSNQKGADDPLVPPRGLQRGALFLPNRHG